jgi:hypothetical protein
MLLEPDATRPRLSVRPRHGEVAEEDDQGLLKSLDRFGSAVAYSSDGALRTLARHYSSPTIVKLADMFQSRRGAADATAKPMTAP